MYEHDTIAAVATPPGQGGVAIVRVSGPSAEDIAQQIFVPRHPRERFLSHHFYLGNFIHPLTRRPIDNGLLVIMRAPRSYTGETVVEFHCHGGSLLPRRILEAVLHQGARLAGPGEFTKRAFLNDRLDLSQAEAVLDLIHAKSDQGLAIAWEQLSGRLSQVYGSLRERLVRLIAHLEAFLDFPDEDIPEKDQDEILQDIQVLLKDIVEVAATFTHGKIFRDGVRTVIIGKPNVGKSSLMNLLAGTERAIVTAIPGTTRDILEETVVVNGIPLVVWDTAGLRSTTDEVERIGVERAKVGIQEAELVLAVFDSSRPFDLEDEDVCAAIGDKQAIIILNKVDLPTAFDTNEIKRRYPARPLVHMSVTNAIEIDTLRVLIQSTVFGASSLLKNNSQESGVIVTQIRHRDALTKAAQCLRQSQEGLQINIPLDLVAVDLRAALDHIGEITGHVSSEDILDRIFQEFCIGK
ncbi:MAG: tRNA uridine-5-carboxymethylaminomethyl(34) synthesis GTPase MnmE [Candidatus Binatia bacterium]